TPFFGTMLNWVNAPDLEFEAIQPDSAPLQNPTAKFDLTLHIMETNAALPASFEYSTGLYEQATIAQMAEHFQNLLAGIVRDSDQRIAELPLLGEEERNQILYAWNQTAREFSAGETLVELLEAQAQKTPQDQAIILEGQAWSYHEL